MSVCRFRLPSGGGLLYACLASRRRPFFHLQRMAPTEPVPLSAGSWGQALSEPVPVQSPSRLRSFVCRSTLFFTCPNSFAVNGVFTNSVQSSSKLTGSGARNVSILFPWEQVVKFLLLWGQAPLEPVPEAVPVSKLTRSLCDDQTQSIAVSTNLARTGLSST